MQAIRPIGTTRLCAGDLHYRQLEQRAISNSCFQSSNEYIMEPVQSTSSARTRAFCVVRPFLGEISLVPYWIAKLP